MKSETSIPELAYYEGSWICTSPRTGKVIELFERTDVEKVSANGWKVETAHTYLVRINAEIRAKAKSA